jgi:hypothetical protein
MLLKLIDKYIWGQLGLANFGNEVIRIKKSQLLSLETLEINNDDLNGSSSFSMPNLKSLRMFINPLFCVFYYKIYLIKFRIFQN